MYRETILLALLGLRIPQQKPLGYCPARLMTFRCSLSRLPTAARYITILLSVVTFIQSLSTDLVNPPYKLYFLKPALRYQP